MRSTARSDAPPTIAAADSIQRRDRERRSTERAPKRSGRVVVVDDEPVQRRVIGDILRRAGYEVGLAASVEEAVGLVGDGGADVVLTDLRMPGASGIDLLTRIREASFEVEVVLMTAFSDVRTAVEAMRRGAYDYLSKPFERAELLATIDKAAERIRLRRENRALRRVVAAKLGERELIGESEAMRRLSGLLDKVAPSMSTVLVRGESGTGKELVARAIHARGPRSRRPFVAINCAAIPPHLVETELFGHERGAFTGAAKARPGSFEEVSDGTLFLDEIGAMPVEIQSKLLRVLQERELVRIGSSRATPFRGRVVAATSEPLERWIHDGRFREDLYFRLNVVPIEVPALRERSGDVPLLATAFLRRFAVEMGKPVERFSDEALRVLEAHDWPGNVRELENLVERVVVLADESTTTIGAQDIPAPSRLRCVVDAADAAGPADLAGRRGTPEAGRPRSRVPAGGDGFVLPAEGVCLSAVERDLIRQALEEVDWRLEPAARLLGITYKTLQYRIRKHGLRRPGACHDDRGER